MPFSSHPPSPSLLPVAGGMGLLTSMTSYSSFMTENSMVGFISVVAGSTVRDRCELATELNYVNGRADA